MTKMFRAIIIYFYGKGFLVKERDTRKDILYGVDGLSVRTPDISKQKQKHQIYQK
jgi:hypothetical protein